MAYRYSRHLFPNTPVECKPKSGQILRSVNSKTHYFHILKTCISENPRKQVRRLLIDLDNKNSFPDHVLRTYELSPEKCTIQDYIRSCSLTSSSICFIDDSIERLATAYLVWIRHCSNIVEEPVKPAAIIVLCNSRTKKETLNLGQEFFTSCTATKEREATYGLSHLCFSRTKTVHLSQHLNPRSKDFIDWRVFEKIQEGSGILNNERISLGYYWKEWIIHGLLKSSLAFYSKFKNDRRFSIAQALSTKSSLPCPDALHQEAFFNSEVSCQKQCNPSDVTSSLLGRYMAYHLLTHHPLLDLENFKSPSGSNKSLFNFLFQLRYHHIAIEMLRNIMPDKITEAAFADSVKNYMYEAINVYLNASQCITKTHISSLGIFHRFYLQQKSHRLCTGCLFAYWDDVLPCYHGFCKACTHNYIPHWKQNARIQISQCPACLQTFSKPFGIPLQPPTAGGRILSLDGGGVKGIIELEILRELSSIIGGNLDIHYLFDMIVGTSIGGIIALGIAVHRWDLDTCKKKFIDLTTQVFSSESSLIGWIKGSLGNVFKYVRYAACIALQNSLISGELIDSILYQEFGESGSMMFPKHTGSAPIKVAVTTCNVRDSLCSIITSYNRKPLDSCKPYTWLQDRNTHLQVKVWEAARCTSAVPFLFPAALLQGEKYYDGALVHNNPTILAMEEAKTFWSSDETRNMVLSIGCGDKKNHRNDREGPFSCCTNSFVEGMSAAKQNNDLVLRGYRFTRLDPFLDIDGVLLDDFQAIPRLQRSFSGMLLHDTAFVEMLRSAAFQVISSIFYLEIVSQPVFSPISMEYSVMGMIRPRLPSCYVKHLSRHDIFGPLHFVIEGRPVSFKMPKKVNIRVKEIDDPIEIDLSCKAYRARISGLPMSVADLLQLQEAFYSRHGSRKRSLRGNTFGQ